MVIKAGKKGERTRHNVSSKALAIIFTFPGATCV